MFIRDGASDIKLDVDVWQYAFQQAAESLGLNTLDTEAVRLPSTMLAPRVDLFTRQYRAGLKATLKTAHHECIREGAELSFKIVLATKSAPGTPSNQRPPTLNELSLIFDLVGARFGISPWGSPKGYGRFRVLHLTESQRLR